MSHPDPEAAPRSESDALEAAAIGLAEKWLTESLEGAVDPAERVRVALLDDRDGVPFVLDVIDGVLRPESAVAAAFHLSRVASRVPDSLPRHLKRTMKIAGQIAPALPTPVVPVARRLMREAVGHLVIDERPARSRRTIEELRGAGVRVNLRPVGVAVLGEDEAKRRIERIHELILRVEVEDVSILVSSVVSPVSLWAFDDTVERIVERLLPLYLSARDTGTFITLDFEAYRHLDLTIAVFTRLLEDPRLAALEAGVALPSALPDTRAVLRELSAWARERVAHGGARITVRLGKGAGLVMERVEAATRGWTLATYDTVLDIDANYLRCLDEALRPEATAAVRVCVAEASLFDASYAWVLAKERGVSADVDLEMMLGRAPAQTDAIRREVGRVQVCAPTAHPDEIDAAVAFLAPRLDHRVFTGGVAPSPPHPSCGDHGRARWRSALARSVDAALADRPRRRAHIERATRPSSADHIDVGETPPAIRRVADAGLTQAVLGIAGGGAGAGETVAAALAPVSFGADLVETAVYAARETRASGARAHFVNIPDSDPALPETRAWAADVLARVADSVVGGEGARQARVADGAALDALLARTRDAGDAWGSRSAVERASILARAAAVLLARRGDLIEAAASETGIIFVEADTEVSEIVDLARYYAATARELDAVSGAIFVPARVTLVASTWDAPLAAPAGGILAALAAGSAVIFTPGPHARRCAAALAEALWEAGVPRETLALVVVDGHDLDRRLVSHPAVERMVLNAPRERASLVRSWRPDLPLLGVTGAKNAMIIAPTADIDRAARDVVASAFAHAGQMRAAASLVILVGPVARSRRFARQLVDAARSLWVGAPDDPRAELGPLIEAPAGPRAWALTTLGEGERWLIEPRALDAARTLWTPGIRTGVEAGSRFHREVFSAPVLGVMHARSLERAIGVQRATGGDLVAGLHTRDPADLERWLATVDAGGLFVNSALTGSIVGRQPFGGGSDSSIGASAKAGGPNYVAALGTWRPSEGGSRSPSLHLRGLDSRLTSVIEAAQATLDYDAFDWVRRAALSDAVAWDREFGRVRDVSQLGVERNLFRYRPVPVAVRAAGDADWRAVLRVILAAVRARSSFALSVPVAMAPPVRRVLAELGVDVRVEGDDEWIERMSTRSGGAESGDASVLSRARLVGSPAAVTVLQKALAGAVGADPGWAIYGDQVTTAARVELLPFLREQSITITAHRAGLPDPWSESVI